MNVETCNFSHRRNSNTLVDMTTNSILCRPHIVQKKLNLDQIYEKNIWMSFIISKFSGMKLCGLLELYFLNYLSIRNSVASFGSLEALDLTWQNRAWLLCFSLWQGSLVKFRQSLFAVHVKAQDWFVSSFMLLNL